MSAKKPVKKALGRNFDSLIPNQLFDESFDPTSSQDEKVSDLRTVNLVDIHADPDQPRRAFDEKALDELAESVKVHGILQPIILTPNSSGGYMIVAGERRFKAAQKAKLEKVPAIIRTLSNQHKLELSLIENLQREDLNVMETATAYAKLRDQFNLTIEQIGERVGGKSQGTISNTMRLLNLPDMIKKALVDKKLTEGQARPLVNLDEKIALELAPKIISENWSARKIESTISALKKGNTTKKQVIAEKPVIYTEAASDLENRLATTVNVAINKRGAGKISISFKNESEFKRIQKLLDS